MPAIRTFSYGNNGFVHLQFGNSLYQFLPGSNPDGVATTVSVNPDGVSFAIKRFNDGVPDTSASKDGTIANSMLPFTPGTAFPPTPDRVYALSGGRTLLEFIVPNKILNSAPAARFVMLKSDFTPDLGYGDNGSVLFSPRPDFTTVQQGDKFIVDGVRYTDDFKIDPAFTAAHIHLADIVPTFVQADGKILFATDDSGVAKIYRENKDGGLDTTFGGGDGIAVGPSSGMGEVLGLAVDDQGLITINATQGLTRFTANGILDTTFGTAGLATPALNSHFVLLPGGQITSRNPQFLFDSLSRINANGTVDTAFGTDSFHLEEYQTASPFKVVPKVDLPQPTSFEQGQVQQDGSILVGMRLYNGRYIEVRIAASGNAPSPVSLNNGVATVTGTDQKDHILFAPGRVGIDPVSVLLNSIGREFAPADVTSYQADGGAGNDVIEVDSTTLALGSDVPCVFDGGDGNDKIVGGSKNDTLSGNAGNDTIVGNAGDDLISGNGGRDKLFGGDGDDHIHGGASGDWLFGQGGNNILFGDGGNDRLYADDAGTMDTLHGNAGNDQMTTSGDGAVDHLFGDGGHDSADADPDDVLTSIEVRP